MNESARARACVCVCVCARARVRVSRREKGWRRRKWPAEKMLDGQRQRVDVPAHDRTADDATLPNQGNKKRKKRKEKKS